MLSTATLVIYQKIQPLQNVRVQTIAGSMSNAETNAKQDEDVAENIVNREIMKSL